MRQKGRRQSVISSAMFVIVVAVVSTQQPTTVTRTVLQRGDVSLSGREAVLAKAQIPTGAATGRHTHPGEEISYVLDGSFRLEVDGEAPKMLEAGDVFMIPAGKVHNATATGAGATIITTYVVEKGKPLATPAN